MSRTDGIDELDPRFPIEKGPTSPAFWDALALWEAYPPRHPAHAFAVAEAAVAVAQNQHHETTFVQPLPPPLPVEAVPRPRVYPELEPDTLAHEFDLTGPLELLP